MLKLLPVQEPKNTFFFQSFSLCKKTKQQDPFQSNSNDFPSTGFPFALTCLVFPSSDLKSSTLPSPGVFTDGSGVDGGQSTVTQ